MKEQDQKLIDAARAGDLEGVKAALKAGADVNAKNKTGYTALIWASSCWGHTAIVEALIVAGADVNAKNENGYTALILAAYWGHTATVKLLIKAGADVNAKNECGETALMKAKRRGYLVTDIVALLRKAGAK
ncbi:MAG: ankyrin repeat domain-containing protein [Candidatus Micrarchaeia archaeon]